MKLKVTKTISLNDTLYKVTAYTGDRLIDEVTAASIKDAVNIIIQKQERLVAELKVLAERAS